MIKKKITIAVTLIIFILGCTKENKQHKNIIVNNFPKKTNLFGYPAHNIDAYTKGHIFLCVVDSFLILLKSHADYNEDKFISIYSTNTHKLLAKTITKGRGPGEFLSPQFTGQIERNIKNNHPIVYIYDTDRNRLTFLNIIKTITNNKHTNKQILLPQIDYKINNLYYYSDSILIASYFKETAQQDGRFLIYNNRTKDINITPYLPEISFISNESDKNMIYYSFGSVNIKRKQIAVAPLQISEIDFFDIKGNYIKSTIFDSIEKLKKNFQKKLSTYDPHYFISSLKTKDSLLYALNLDNLEDDLFKTMKINNISLLVFDWNGKPIKKYIFADNRIVFHFAIDMPHKRIYTFCPNEKEHNIIVYDFNKN